MLELHLIKNSFVSFSLCLLKFTPPFFFIMSLCSTKNILHYKKNSSVYFSMEF